MGKQEEIEGGIRNVLSSASYNMNSQTLNLDGGFQAQ
jgi:hypothetical protein